MIDERKKTAKPLSKIHINQHQLDIPANMQVHSKQVKKKLNNHNNFHCKTTKKGFN